MIAFILFALLSGFSLDGEKWTYQGDGLTLSGILLKPDGAGPFPAIVISHGRGGNAGGFAMSKAREMVKWGFVCIGTDYTHAGGPGKPVAPGPNATFGASEENLKRASKCIEILDSLAYVDKKKICAYGNSMGAFLTVALAARMPERIAAAAITAGGLRDEGGLYPSSAVAANVRCPLLIVHGSADRVVPPETSLRLKEILDRSGTPNDRRVFEGVGHNVHAEKVEDVNALMRAWFARHRILP